MTDDHVRVLVMPVSDSARAPNNAGLMLGQVLFRRTTLTWEAIDVIEVLQTAPELPDSLCRHGNAFTP
ncbi:hypothetical protein LDL36_18140 [Komagataeibacter sp. FNDCR1]|nr:hypothetical protein [Komagataeibacter sp. FNDCR1]